MSKPNVMIDDQNVVDWRLCLEIHPQEIEFTQAAQYLKQLGLSRFS